MTPEHEKMWSESMHAEKNTGEAIKLIAQLKVKQKEFEEIRRLEVEK